jgi:hypothetical protein
LTRLLVFETEPEVLCAQETCRMLLLQQCHGRPGCAIAGLFRICAERAPLCPRQERPTASLPSTMSATHHVTADDHNVK